MLSEKPSCASLWKIQCIDWTKLRQLLGMRGEKLNTRQLVYFIQDYHQLFATNLYHSLLPHRPFSDCYKYHMALETGQKTDRPFSLAATHLNNFTYNLHSAFGSALCLSISNHTSLRRSNLESCEAHKVHHREKHSCAP